MTASLFRPRNQRITRVAKPEARQVAATGAAQVRALPLVLGKAPAPLRSRLYARCFLALRGFTLARFEFLYRLSFFGLTTLGLYGFFDAIAAVDVSPQPRTSASASVRNFMSLDTTNWRSGTSTSSENSDPSRESLQ